MNSERGTDSYATRQKQRQAAAVYQFAPDNFLDVNLISTANRLLPAQPRAQSLAGYRVLSLRSRLSRVATASGSGVSVLTLSPP